LTWHRAVCSPLVAEDRPAPQARSPLTREPLKLHYFPNIALRQRIKAHSAEELRVAETVRVA
jgi:hypothetical protein